MKKGDKPFDAIVVGSGLAGLSSAVALVDSGKKVLILESRDVLGGRTSSWNEKGMDVESGLHRYLGFYEAMPALLKKVGVDLDDIIFWEDEIEIKMPDGEPSAVFGASPLHKPLKSLSSFIFNNDFLPPIEKAKLGVFFTHGFLKQKNNPEKLDEMTVYEYAKKHKIDEEIITRVLIPLTEGLFFLPIKRYSALNFFSLFAPYLTKFHKARVGAFSGGMTEVLINPLVKYIEKKGGEVRINSPVERLIVKDDGVRGVILKGKEIRASGVVMGASLQSAQEVLVKDYKNHEWFKPMFSLKTMPSVTFQIELKEPSREIDRTTFSPKTIYSAYAEQSRSTFKKTKGRISIILAEPEKFLKTKDTEILRIVLEDAKRLGLNLPESNIKGFRKISWPYDFYSYEKGMIQKRPAQTTPIPGLAIAGDYTEQEYLQTMEGAVVSGQRAAESIINL